MSLRGDRTESNATWVEMDAGIRAEDHNGDKLDQQLEQHRRKQALLAAEEARIAAVLAEAEDQLVELLTEQEQLQSAVCALHYFGPTTVRFTFKSAETSLLSPGSF